VTSTRAVNVYGYLFGSQLVGKEKGLTNKSVNPLLENGDRHWARTSDLHRVGVALFQLS
jgi:hypothetical protein